MYGKRAQRVGRNPPFACIVSAGLITSICRTMILDAIGAATNPWHILDVATDGIRSRVPLRLRAPLPTGTERAAEWGKLPLGSWEEKVDPHGVFLVRPGLRFSLDPNGLPSGTAARGVGVNHLHANRQALLDAWEARTAPLQPVHIQQSSQFHGAKVSLGMTIHPMTGEPTYTKRPHYGTWTTPPPRRIGFEPTPKRSHYLTYPTGEPIRLAPWSEGRGPSQPYRIEKISAVAEELKQLALWAEEQDGETTDALGD
jgi:hypothetical protein